MLHGFFKKSLFALAALAMAGCASAPDDEDAIRSGATEIQMDVVVQEVIAPTNGDRVDWKLITVPSPGTITMELVLVDKNSIFGVEFKIYDRFGIPVKKQSIEEKETTSQKFLTLTALLPEGGMHFVKIEAEGGETDYTIVAKGFEPASGFDIPVSEVSFTIDEEMDGAAGGGGDDAGAKSGGSSAKSGGSSTKSTKDDDEDDTKKSDKKDKGSKSSDSGSKIKPIVNDIKGSFDKIDGKITNVTPKGNGSTIRINIGSSAGVREGSVGEIYDASGKLIKGARFKVTKISGSASQCETNASADDLEGAKKVVVKSPK